MESGISRVLAAVSSNSPSRWWLEQRKVIAEQRLRLEALLVDKPGYPVYGFTTLLGQLDDTQICAEDQYRLLDGHLVGDPSPLHDPMPLLLLATKIEQLAQGGSGVHFDTYDLLLDRCSRPLGSLNGAWLASYGSADVVPGAWWVQGLAGGGARPKLYAGDLIALISGNFVSTAFALAASLQLIGYLSAFLEHAIAAADAVPVGASAASRTWLYRELAVLVQKHPPHRAIQRPVSTRDLSVYVSPIAKVVDDLRDALEFRLAGCTSNPLFVFPPGAEPVAVSQAGFLDLRLSMALTAAAQAVLFCMGGIQRFTQHFCDSRRALPPAQFIPFVQPPKVALALLSQARLAHGAMATTFSMAESAGIEDLGDMSLALADALQKLVSRGKQQLTVLASLSSPDQAPVRSEQIRDLLTARFCGGGEIDKTRHLERVLDRLGPAQAAW